MTTAREAEMAWIDLESTGVDTRTGDKLLQIAVILTDLDFNEIDTIEAKFYFSPAEVEKLKAQANSFVKDMHATTGLWDRLSDEGNPTQEDFDLHLLAWLQAYQPAAKALYFGGNSITLDREFMREFLPKSYEHLSHRSMDMTSVELFLVGSDGRPRFQKKLTHEALEDIRESLAQARYNRELSKKAL